MLMEEDLKSLLLAFQKWQVFGHVQPYREFRQLADDLAEKYDVHLPDFEDELELEKR